MALLPFPGELVVGPAELDIGLAVVGPVAALVVVGLVEWPVASSLPA